jgi:hypothetical protein
MIMCATIYRSENYIRKIMSLKIAIIGGGNLPPEDAPLPD